MEKWECTVCGYIYNPDEGDLEAEIPPGTTFGELPENWICPECGVSKEYFEKVEE